MRRSQIRAVAKLIYDAVYLPGEEDDDGEPMPPFDEAETEDIGGYERAMIAAAAIKAFLDSE